MKASAPEDEPRGPLNPLALTLPDAAQLLSKAGGTTIGVVTLQADLDAGAPVNENGTLNLIHFTAWLIKESNDGD